LFHECDDAWRSGNEDAVARDRRTAPAEENSVAERLLGERIRARRRELGLTLVQVAERADLSHPFVSQIERGRAQPSMASLHRLARALGVTQDWLLAAGRPFSADQLVAVQRAGKSLVVSHAGRGTARQLLSAPGHFVPTEFSYDSQDFEEFFQHDGVEFVYVAQGALEVELGGGVDGAGSELYVLDAGDCLRYPGSVPHRWRSAQRSPTRVLMIHPDLTASGGEV
jgi:transcriptional regulator with XRE-family HTH domain